MIIIVKKSVYQYYGIVWCDDVQSGKILMSSKDLMSVPLAPNLSYTEWIRGCKNKIKQNDKLMIKSRGGFVCLY
jgi:hypothetical protein